METGWTRGVVTVELLEPAGRARGGVLVVHSWWGLTDSFRRYGAALAAEGYRVGLADLFGGATATTEDEARALRAARRPRPDYRTLSAGLDAVRGAAADLPLATVGFSMGGHWAAWLAGRAAYGLSAAVLYYAARARTSTGGRACSPTSRRLTLGCLPPRVGVWNARCTGPGVATSPTTTRARVTGSPNRTGRTPTTPRRPRSPSRATSRS